MNRGIVYVSFGKNCDIVASHTVAYSRRFTDLPICILTNIKERNKKWKGISNVSFIEIRESINQNRDIKTRMNEYTPFDETLYLDCDSVIKHPDIKDVFETLLSYDMVLNKFIFWEKNMKILRLYRTAMRLLEISLPLTIYNGAFICFKKNNKVNKFFSVWNKNWKITGRGREMPALACSIKKTGIDVGVMRKDFFSPDYYVESSTVQHNFNPMGNSNFWNKYGIPYKLLAKPFDRKSSRADWNWVSE